MKDSSLRMIINKNMKTDDYKQVNRIWKTLAYAWL